jgi:hypothetical protein
MAWQKAKGKSKEDKESVVDPEEGEQGPEEDPGLSESELRLHGFLDILSQQDNSVNVKANG